jgi:NAD(P)-dependent dehydrogenase (short-subunit alcohol dehydrogenase family)
MSMRIEIFIGHQTKNKSETTEFTGKKTDSGFVQGTGKHQTTTTTLVSRKFTCCELLGWIVAEVAFAVNHFASSAIALLTPVPELSSHKTTTRNKSKNKIEYQILINSSKASLIMTRKYNQFIKTLPKLDGKVIVITGTTSGTGYVAAKTVAELGAEVVLLNRASSRSTDSLAKLKEDVPDGKFVAIECDLQSFDSVRSAIKKIKSKYDKIYCLSNNAGIMATPDEATEDGFDTQMQTNHLSHFLLTAELFPLLEAEANATGDARIVNHSSLGREFTPNKGLEEKYFKKNGGNLGGDEQIMMGGGPFHRYFQTKLANSVFTYALDEKLKAKGSKVRAVCAHPGGTNTNLANHLSYGFFRNFIFQFLMFFFAQSSEDGSMGLITGMVSESAESGVLYGPWNGMSGWPKPNSPKKYETDPDAIAMLWKTSEEATGVTFTI